METRPTLFDDPRQQQSSTSDTLVLKAKYKWSPNGSTKVSKGKQSLQRTLTCARPCRGKSNCEDPCDKAEAGLLGTQYYLKRSSCFTVSILHCHCCMQATETSLLSNPQTSKSIPERVQHAAEPCNGGLCRVRHFSRNPS
jgi:hypothetical protein